ncbi:substrate-binding domain-containing protein [Segnochrobactrum spirostomi]|uniref:substrate-binding domain-containing protein n=1 Tax=Segnochrobactrum spirostomi TaxID=2608987 RepID=UPI001AD82EE5|nr:substrate-binding domain-containing protein [Segnochrobactrum spirostomi]
MCILGALAGCKEERKPEQAAHAAAPTAKPQVALVMKTLTNPFFAEMERGARQAAAEEGANILVKAASKETSIDQQIGIIDALVHDKVAAIVVAPGDSVRLIPPLKTAQDAGIVVVNVDNRLDPAFAKTLDFKAPPFVSIDNERAAYAVTRRLIAALPARTTGAVEAAVIEGIPDANNSAERKAGALKAFGEAPNIRVVAVQSGNWRIEEGYAAARTILREHPHVKLIFCANDMMALGVVRYLADSKTSGVLVAGFDALPEARRAIASGALVASADQNARQQGYLGVKAAMTLLKGAPVEPATQLDATVIDSANADVPTTPATAPQVTAP